MDRKTEIKELLKQSGLTIDFLADRIGIPKDEAAYYLNRSLPINLDLYIKMKEVLEPFAQVGMLSITNPGADVDAKIFDELQSKLMTQEKMIELLMQRVDKLETIVKEIQSK